MRFLATALVLVSASVSFHQPALAAEKTTYEDDLKFLARYTNVLELTDGHQARVAICPEYQGRVMTSTCAGLRGPSFGWINREFIAAHTKDPHFNNYGGEDRFWLAPEGGQFALWFAPGSEQTLDTWFTPPALNDGHFRVISSRREPFYRLGRQILLSNASNTQFDLNVTRTVRLLRTSGFAGLFGSEAAEVLGGGGVRMVGFETVNRIANRGPTMSREKGLVSIWVLGMFRPSPETVIIVPYRSGDEAELGPVVQSDYFGEVPPQRLKVTPKAVLLRGDGNYRSKIGVSPRRVLPVAGSIDFGGGVLTLVHFSLPEKPEANLYVNNTWMLPQENPYEGDAVNSYNDGPPEPGAESLGGFYELESLSPARPLGRGESLSHHHRTFHVQGDPAALARLAKIVLGVELDEVREQMPH